jgi:hypothetical protein
MLVLHCHCRDCQYASGGDGSTALIVSADDLSIEGTAASFAASADSGNTVIRQFCGTCGSPLFAKSPVSPALLAIKAATLDDPSWLAPAAHIWMDSAPPWACVPAGLLIFPKNFGEA